MELYSLKRMQSSAKTNPRRVVHDVLSVCPRLIHGFFENRCLKISCPTYHVSTKNGTFFIFYFCNIFTMYISLPVKLLLRKL